MPKLSETKEVIVVTQDVTLASKLSAMLVCADADSARAQAIAMNDLYKDTPAAKWIAVKLTFEVIT